MKSLEIENDIESFLFNALIPEHCREDSSSKEMLNYNIGVYPNKKSGAKKPIDYMKKTYQLLKSNIPVKLSFCASKEKGKCLYHTAVIKGLKKVCRINNSRICEMMVQFHNSYGEPWQNKYNGGWVRFTPIIDNFIDKNHFNWLEAPDERIFPLSYQEEDWIKSTVVVLYGDHRLKMSQKPKINIIYKCGNAFSNIKKNKDCVVWKSR